LRHIAKEGRVYVLGCCMALRKDHLSAGLLKERFYAGVSEWINTGDSAIVNPEGEIIAGPLHEKEDILYAEVEPRQLRGPKWMLDVAGHYARPDIFELIVHTEERPMLSMRQDRTQPARQP
jgi:nitrilase